MAKTTKAKPVSKTIKKPAPAAKSTKKNAAVKATVKGKTAVKVATPKAKAPAKPVKAAAPKVAPAKTVAKVAAKPVAKAPAKAPVKAVAPAPAPVAKKPAVVKHSHPILKSRPVAPKSSPFLPLSAGPVMKKTDKLDFGPGDFVVYPAHGVGYVEGVETQMIAGMEITLYTISFEKDRMRLKLPISKVKASGLRKLSSKDRLKDALSTLQGKSQTRRIMWSRRAQEYEAKINSGDPVSIAEVLRDLRKADDQSEQSYSERQIYQAALERLAREVAAIEKIDEKKAAERLEAVLSNVA
jgi:CarD family transcriptional regulator